MASREHETVTITPVGVTRVVMHDATEENVGKWSERHSGSLVAAVRDEWAIHGDPTDHRNGLRILLLSKRHERDISGVGQFSVRAIRNRQPSAGGRRVNGTMCQASLSTRQWANTGPYSLKSSSPLTRR